MSHRRSRTEAGRVFLLSGISGQVRKDLIKKITTLGGKFFDIPDFKALCTHVVCGKLSRSEKFLGACATGKWVLHPDYVHHSCSAGTWLEEEQYEWCDDGIRTRYHEVSNEMLYASRRWRFTLGEQGKAFSGWKVAVVSGEGNSTLLKRLLISGGAEVFNLKLPIKNPAKVANMVGFVFVSDQNIHKVSTLFRYGVLCVRPNFIGDYLIKDPPADPMDYLVSQNLHGDENQDLDSPGGDTATTTNQDADSSAASSQETWLRDSQLSTPQKKGDAEAAVEASPLNLFPSPYGQIHPVNVYPLSTTCRPTSPYGHTQHDNSTPTNARKALFPGDVPISPASSTVTDLTSTLPSTSSSTVRTDIPGTLSSPETTDLQSSETTDIPSTLPSSDTTYLPSTSSSSETTDLRSTETTDIPGTLPSSGSSAGSCERNEPSTSAEELPCAKQSSEQHVLSSFNIESSQYIPQSSSQSCVKSSQAAYVDSPVKLVIKRENRSVFSCQLLDTPISIPSSQSDVGTPIFSQSGVSTPVFSQSGASTTVSILSSLSGVSTSISSQSGVCNQDMIDLTHSSDDTEELVIPYKPKKRSRRSTTNKSSPAWKGLIPKSRVQKRSSSEETEELVISCKPKKKSPRSTTTSSRAWKGSIPKSGVKKQSSNAAKVKKEMEDIGNAATPTNTPTSTPRKVGSKRPLCSKALLANMSPITKFFKPVTPGLVQIKEETISPVKKALTPPVKGETVKLPSAMSSHGEEGDLVMGDALRRNPVASSDQAPSVSSNNNGVGSSQGVSGTGSGRSVSGAGSGQGVSGAGTGQGVSSAGIGQGVSSAGISQGVSGTWSGQGVSGAGSGKSVSGAGSGQGVSGAGSGQGVSGAGSGQGMSRITGNMAILEGSGQLEEGQVYEIRDKHGVSSTRIWSHGELKPYTKQHKSTLDLRQKRDLLTPQQSEKEAVSAIRNICTIDPLDDENVMRSETLESEAIKTRDLARNEESSTDKSNSCTIDNNDGGCGDTAMECDDAEIETAFMVVNRDQCDEANSLDSLPCAAVDAANRRVDGEASNIEMDSKNREVSVDGTDAAEHEDITSCQRDDVGETLVDAGPVQGDVKSCKSDDVGEALVDVGLLQGDVRPCQTGNYVVRSTHVITLATEEQRSAVLAASSSMTHATEEQRSAVLAASSNKPGPVVRWRVKEAEVRAALHEVRRAEVSRSEYCSSVWLCNQKQGEVHDDVAMEISDPLTQIMFSVLDEEYVTVLREIIVQTSLKSYPSPKLISTLIHKVFLTNGEDLEVNLMYQMLMKMIQLHPPTNTAMQDMYLDVLTGMHGHKDRQIAEAWNSIKLCINDLLTKRDDSTWTRGRLLLLKFIKQLLTINLKHDFQYKHGDGGYEKTGRNLLVKILWCPSYHVALNSKFLELMDLLLDAINCYRAQGPSDRVVVKEVLQFITWLIVMATECSRVQECRTSKGLDSLGAQKTSEFVQNIAAKIVSANIEDLTLLECLFTSLQLPWLRVGVCQQILNSLDDYLVTVDQSNTGTSISLSLILSRYMFLLPRFHEGVNARKSTLSILRTKPARRTIKNEGKGLVENNDVNKRGSDCDKLIAKVNKRNAKGETRLHTACIKNDFNTLRQLLSVPGIDVNVTDNAGWTPLHEACNHGSVECVQELLKFVPSKTLESFFKATVKCHKVDLLACNSDGITPLHDAVMNDRQEVCRLLLQHGGARLLAPVTRLGYKPQDLATTDEMVMLLLAFEPVKRKFSQSQDSLVGSQDSFTSLDESRMCTPAEHLYQEVTTGDDGSRMYCSTRALQVYIYHVTTLVRSYITSRNIARIKQILTDPHKTQSAAVRHGVKKLKLSSELLSENQSLPQCDISNDRASSLCDISRQSAASGSKTDFPECNENYTKITTINCSTKHSDSTDNSGFVSDRITSSGRKRPHCFEDKDLPRPGRSEEKENSGACNHQFTSSDSVSSNEDVEELRQDLKAVKNLTSHVNMFRNHVFRLCNPEDKSVIESKLLELSFLVSYLE